MKPGCHVWNLFPLSLSTLQSAIKSCSRCQHFVASDEPFTEGENSDTAVQTVGQGSTEQNRETGNEASMRAEQRKENQEETEYFRTHIRELEQELAQTKLQMVEAKCKIQVRTDRLRIHV